MAEFKEFEKIPRLNRPVIITEKLDGTNACVVVEEGESGLFEDRLVFAQSRNRIITVDSDNYRFAKWVEDNKETLKQLGPGYHYGEWWGRGIQRDYGLTEKRFSLFNTSRWKDARPACCHVVPILSIWNGFGKVEEIIEKLRAEGSIAAPGFMDPEGIIMYHAAAQHYFKVTIKGDESPKGKQA
jgi:hypothetical protein